MAGTDRGRCSHRALRYRRPHASLRDAGHRGLNTPAGQAIAARIFAAARQAGQLAIADYANTRNPKLISADATTTWALLDMPNPDIPSGAGVMDRIEPALRAAAPAGAKVSVTGFEQIQTLGGSGGGGGPSVLVETLIGGIGALAALAFVFGSAVAIIPPPMPGLRPSSRRAGPT